MGERGGKGKRTRGFDQNREREQRGEETKGRGERESRLIKMGWESGERERQ
jgi:hypothetical protein